MATSLAKKERIGIIAVVLVALLLTGVLLLVKSPLTNEAPSAEETSVAMDSSYATSSGDTEVIYKEKRKAKKKARKGRKKSKSSRRGKKSSSASKSAPVFRDMEEDTLAYPE